MDQSLPTLNVAPRSYRFELSSELSHDWHGGSAFKTAFFNALSLQFPEGERQFIHAVRLFQKRVQDPDLQRQVRGFIGQEAMHGREHERYNEALEQRGYDVAAMNRRFQRRMAFLKTLPPKVQLAGTCGAEHVTAVLAHGLLTHPDWMQEVPEGMKRLWYWHALEETEHKSVAFDVYRDQVGDETLRRVIYLYVLFDFVRFTLRNMSYMLKKDGQLWRWRVWVEGVRFFWGKEGVIRRSMPLFRRYFRRGFHPWQHDNRRVMEFWQEKVDGSGPSPAAL